MIGHLERAYARTLMALGLGRVAVTKDSGPTPSMQVRMEGTQEVRDNLDALAHYGFASRPKPGADAAVIFLGGNRGAGIVIATGDRRYRVALAEGEVCLHDDLGHKIHLKRSGIEIDGGGHDVKVLGRLVATGDVVAGAVSVQGHVHKNTQPGSGLSGVPNGAP